MTQLFVQLLGHNPLVLDAIRRGKPAVVKLVDPDRGLVDAVREASPKTTIVGRLVEDHQGRLNAGEGQRFAHRVILKANELDVQIWEGSNEAIAGGLDDMRRLNDFEYAFAEQLNNAGLKPMVGGFSTGLPEIVSQDESFPWLGEWEAFYPAMQIAWGVHFHEYWHPRQLEDRWNAYRYNKWWPALPDWAKEKWWLISELGIDGGLAGDGRSGWQNYTNAARYIKLLADYDGILRQYPRIAATIFAAGMGIDQSWSTFDIAYSDVLDQLVRGWQTNKCNWGVDTEGPNMDVKDLDIELKAACLLAGIEYDNLIGHFKDKPDASWLVQKRDFAKLKGVAFHHSAGAFNGSTQSIYDANLRRGLGGFAYHFVGYCYRNSQGKVWRKLRLMRHPQDFGAHVKDNNHEWVGLLWPGTYHETPPDVEVQTAMAEMTAIVVKVLRSWTGNKALGVKGHGQILPNYTACPDGGRWFASSFVPLFEKALAGESQKPDEPLDAYTRGWNDSLSQVIATMSRELEKLRR